MLNYLWHRAEWPPIERIAGATDVVHAAHPLMIPAATAAQVVTIHDLFFLSWPDQTTAEIRRDYPGLAASHARRAHAVVTSSRHGKQEVVERLGVDAERVYVCSPGAPVWRRLGRGPNIPEEGYVLFIGTLEPRKNLGILLDAWERVRSRHVRTSLLIAGRATGHAQEWLARIAAPPLAGTVKHVGYVPAEEREPLFTGARALVLPSLEEGFGLPALEAMSAGIPVIASNRGALPEVVGDSGVLIDPTDCGDLADAIDRVLTDPSHATSLALAGLERARAFSWDRAAATLRIAYTDAVARRGAAR